MFEAVFVLLILGSVVGTAMTACQPHYIVRTHGADEYSCNEEPRYNITENPIFISKNSKEVNDYCDQQRNKPKK